HVEGQFDKDDKKTKRTARAMMRMVASINSGSFDGQRQVTCYSCHRGRKTPSSMEVSEAGALRGTANATTEKLPTDLPAVSEIIGRYVSALGGVSAVEAISSRHESGVWQEGSERGEVEIFADGHEKYALVRHSKSDTRSAILNGASGQIASPGRTPLEMTKAERDFATMDADLQRPLHLRNVFRDLKEEHPEKIGDHEALVVVGELTNDRSVKFYFDRNSGLLLREVRFADSTLGQIPTQIDYEEYRESDGVQIPAKITVTDTQNVFTMHFSDVRQNVAIDPKVFTSNGARPQR
ncbi:MAG TPA: photosynthetic reaction center cytochrome c subunit family protein, partial [Candidatus Acidoferrum sp.]|nr:photosynthetic reaction center cytochrome c subunit family protein [Candidatus Acidoferrum sp.]